LTTSARGSRVGDVPNVESLRKVNVVGMSNPSSEQDELIQHIVDPGSDATHDREAVKTLAGHLTI
jgi:hypothetical protein